MPARSHPRWPQQRPESIPGEALPLRTLRLLWQQVRLTQGQPPCIPAHRLGPRSSLVAATGTVRVTALSHCPRERQSQLSHKPYLVRAGAGWGNRIDLSRNWGSEILPALLPETQILCQQLLCSIQLGHSHGSLRHSTTRQRLDLADQKQQKNRKARPLNRNGPKRRAGHTEARSLGPNAKQRGLNSSGQHSAFSIHSRTISLRQEGNRGHSVW